MQPETAFFTKRPASAHYLRRQYLINNERAPPFAGWRTMQAESARIHYHPDLAVTQCRTGSATVSLIGFAIDPNNSRAKDPEIVAHLAESLTTRETVLDVASRLGGRWVLMVEHDDFSILLHDACGLRQIFYSDQTLSPPFCVSQASTAAKVYRLEEDPEAVDEFLRTNSYQTDPEPWWPGDSTRYRGMRCLLPNHYLDLRSREVHRYGLRAKLPDTPLDVAAGEAAKILAHLIHGAAQRHPLALPITAGWDSRAILAACAHVGLMPYCYTLKMAGYGHDHQDIRVPQRLLASIGLDHHVIDCSSAPPADFVAFYKAMTYPAHDDACALAASLYQAFPEDFISLSGHCSEIARCFYDLPRTDPVTPELLARLAHMDATPFVLKQFQRWLDGAVEIAEQTGLSLLDLFYWEQRAGRWAANGQAQWDFVHERFTAFNCRPLLLTLLSVDATHRRSDYALYRRMIHNLAPDLLDEPINPDTTPERWKRNLPKAIMRRAKAALKIASR